MNIRGCLNSKKTLKYNLFYKNKYQNKNVLKKRAAHFLAAFILKGKSMGRGMAFMEIVRYFANERVGFFREYY